MSELSPEEYGRLSDQKADDWRHISEVNPTLFGVAGAIFAAGIAENDAAILALSPLPLFLGVFHMIRSAKLQMQMITYLAERSPTTAGRWEQDITRLLRPVWRARESGGLSRFLGFVGRPSAWNTWLGIALVTDILVNLTGWLGKYDGAPTASVWGVVAALVLGALLALQARVIEKERDMWTAAWRTDAQEDSKDEDVERAARIARYEK